MRMYSLNIIRLYEQDGIVSDVLLYGSIEEAIRTADQEILTIHRQYEKPFIVDAKHSFRLDGIFECQLDRDYFVFKIEEHQMKWS